MGTMKLEMCFADAGKNCQIIDAVIGDKGMYGGKTLEQLREEYPEVVLMPFDEAEAKYTGSFVTAPTEITEENFWYFLEVLPPYGWVRRADAESFYMSEFTCGDVTQHLVRIGKRYYKFEDHVMRDHDDRVKKCLDLHRATEASKGEAK